MRNPAFKRAEEMRTLALETTEDELNVDAGQWYEAQSQKLEVLSRVEVVESDCPPSSKNAMRSVVLVRSRAN